MSTRTRIAALLLPALVLAGCAGDGDTDAGGADTAGAGSGAATSTSADTGTDGADSTDSTDGTDGTDADMIAAGECGATGTEMVEVGAAGEPGVEFPLLPGWERNTQMDSELVRIVLSKPELAANGFAPTVVLTAEPSPADPQVALERQLTGISDMLGPDEPATMEGEICGHPSMGFEYTLPPMAGAPERLAEVQLIVVPHGAEAIAYSVTAQTTEPTDPDYQRDLETMLTGIRISD